PPPPRHSFPPRRSSDLEIGARGRAPGAGAFAARLAAWAVPVASSVGRATRPPTKPNARPTLRLTQTDDLDMVFSRKRHTRGAARSEEHTSELQSRENLV